MSGNHAPGTPAAAGYRMPAEWEPQAATWLAWPHNEDTFAFLEDVERVFARFVKSLHGRQAINILAGDDDIKARATRALDQESVPSSGVRLVEIPAVDVWIRDYGPTFVTNPHAREPLAMVSWRFNAWGNKYEDLALDDCIPSRMNDMLRLPVFEPGIVMEGGSIDVNGAGCVLTTEQCLLNQNRNPGLERGDIERCMRDHLGVGKVLWLGEGIAGDDTDGHVDDIARFVDAGTIACAVEDDSGDENFHPLRENLERLRGMVDVTGRPFRIVPLPMPGPVEFEGDRYPASYLNFYIGNGIVVVPVFGHENDKRALAILESMFPGRAVTGIDCTTLVYGFGTLHCSSQQQPAT